MQVDDLRAGVDPDARIGVVKRRRVPRRIERRLGDLVHRPRLLEIGIDAGVDEGIVAFHRFAQGRAGHWPPLVRVDDPPCQFLDCVGAEEITGGIDVGRLHVPLFAGHGVGVEDRPDRAAAIELLGIAGPRQRRRIVFVVPGRNGLVIEAKAVLLHQDHILVVLDDEAERAGAKEMRTAGIKLGDGAVALLAHPSLGDQVVVLGGLTGRCAERCPDFHGGDFAVAGALCPLAVFGLVLLGEPDVEHGAEHRVPGAAAGGDDDALARPDVHGAGLGPVGVIDFDGRDAGDAAVERALPVNFRHLLLQQDLDAHPPGRLLQWPDEA